MNAAELAQRHGSFEFSFFRTQMALLGQASPLDVFHWTLGADDEKCSLRPLRFTKTKVRCNKDVVKATVVF